MEHKRNQFVHEGSCWAQALMQVHIGGQLSSCYSQRLLSAFLKEPMRSAVYYVALLSDPTVKLLFKQTLLSSSVGDGDLRDTDFFCLHTFLIFSSLMFLILVSC